MNSPAGNGRSGRVQDASRRLGSLLGRLQRHQPVKPERITTDGLASYASALRELGLARLHWPGRLRENNRVENAHLPIRRSRAASSLSQVCFAPGPNTRVAPGLELALLIAEEIEEQAAVHCGPMARGGPALLDVTVLRHMFRSVIMSR